MELNQYPTLDLGKFEEALEKLSTDALKKEQQRIWTYYNKIKAVIDFKQKMEDAHK